MITVNGEQVAKTVDAALAGNTVGIIAWHAIRESLISGRNMTLKEVEAFSEAYEEIIADPRGGLVVKMGRG